MRTIWSSDKEAVKIYGDISPHPIIVTAEVVNHFGTADEAFHAIHWLRQYDRLPRPSASEAHPFSMRDIALAEENEQRGTRHWRFGRLQNSHEWIIGYYYIDGEYAVFSGGTRWKL